MRKGVFMLLFLSVFVLASCNGGNAGGEQPDYEQTKKMLVDMLKTDDGKKAIQDIMNEESMKEKLVLDQDIVKNTIQQSLTSDKGKEFWKKSFDDPKFAESVAKSMRKENEELLKDLMKDPEYQGMMIDIIKDPEVQKDLAQAFKSKDFREHLQTVITETLDSPLYKAKIQDILIKAADEMKQGGGGQGGGQEGGQGGGGEQGGQEEESQ